MQLIQSRQNKIVKEILSLKDKKNRRKTQRFLIEGFRFVREAFLSGVKVEKLCFSSEIASKTHQELESLIDPEVACFEVPMELFRQLAETDSPQGVLAVVHIPERSLQSLYQKGTHFALVPVSLNNPIVAIAYYFYNTA